MSTKKIEVEAKDIRFPVYVISDGEHYYCRNTKELNETLNGYTMDFDVEIAEIRKDLTVTKMVKKVVSNKTVSKVVKR